MIVIDDLVTTIDGQASIELPICLGNINKMLYNIQIVSGNPAGFKRNTSVRLELEIDSNKLLLARASAEGQSVFVEPINPFANKELTTDERIVLKAERQANIEAEKNGGKPSKEGLTNLYKAYEKVGNDLRAAETLKLLNELYPHIHNYNQIGLFYSSAGHDDKAAVYYELAYQNAYNATTAFNYAHILKHKNHQKYREILEEALRLEPDMPHSLYELGKLLKKENNPSGAEMIKKAFAEWKHRFDTNRMEESDYSWLSSAENLGMYDFALQVRQSKPTFQGDRLYNTENLTKTRSEDSLIKM